MTPLRPRLPEAAAAAATPVSLIHGRRGNSDGPRHALASDRRCCSCCLIRSMIDAPRVRTRCSASLPPLVRLRRWTPPRLDCQQIDTRVRVADERVTHRFPPYSPPSADRRTTSPHLTLLLYLALPCLVTHGCIIMRASMRRGIRRSEGIWLNCACPRDSLSPLLFPFFLPALEIK